MLWQLISKHYPIIPPEQVLAENLLAEYRKNGYLAYTCRNMLELPTSVIAHFYATLEQASPTPPLSPVAQEANAGWMTATSFSFVNVRATGIGTQTGTFIQAAKLLPSIRAEAIHLAPFTLYGFDIIYAVASVESIAPALIDTHLEQANIGGKRQVKALVDAAHLLGKTIGFDLEPHVAQFAIPVLMHPEYFRWIKLQPVDKQWLDYGQSNAEMLLPENQAQIVQEVRTIVQWVLAEAQLDTLEIEDNDPQHDLKNNIRHTLIHQLIDSGYWTILSHAWSGVGIPEFKEYHPRNYPVFRYKNAQGVESGDRTFGVLTPFKFYNGIPPNHAPNQRPTPAKDVWDYYTRIFTTWCDSAGFDFIRHDSVDHIVDSIAHGDSHFPTSDRPSPALLTATIDASKAPHKPYIGNLAERMGNEFKEYAAMGFDVMLGSDMFEDVNRAHLEKCFWLYDELTHLNANRPSPFSITYAVDTHDTGDPHLFGMSLIQKLGSAKILQRQFIARFISVGTAQRPKYEVMGIQDMSFGLAEANVKALNLNWVGNITQNRNYHRIENVYERYRSLLREGRITERWVSDEWAWWRIENGRDWLVALVAWNADHVLLELPGDGVSYDFLRDAPQPVYKRWQGRLHHAPAYWLFAGDA